jgi:hypothetical protein
VAPVSMATACSPMIASHRAMSGRTPDCIDRNTAAIYGDRAKIGSNPTTARQPHHKGKVDSKITKSNATEK